MVLISIMVLKPESFLRLIASLATAHPAAHKNHPNCLTVTISL